MKNKVLLTCILVLTLAVCFSCGRPVELLPFTPLTKIGYVYQPGNDVYSVMAIPENQIGSTTWSPIPLFANSSKAITYLLNGKSTQDRAVIKDAFLSHAVHEILVGENTAKGQKLVVINYKN